MSELMAFIYESETGAKDLEADLIKAENVKVSDAALVVRQADGRPVFSHAVDLVGRGSMGGIFWGFILALVFWTKWWGLSVGSALGDLRLDEEFVKNVGDSVGKGHSAMLAFVEDDTVETVLEAAESTNPKVVRSTFSQTDQQILQTIFQAAREIP